MNISQNGIDLIKKWEGGPWLTAKRFGAEIYLSIGYGHYGPDVKVGQKITKEEAEKLLLKDIQTAVNHVNTVNNKYGYKFNQNEFDALVSFAYNIGNINQLTANGTRTRSVIAFKMLEYVKSGGVTLPGLVNRRKDEQKLFLSDLNKSGVSTFMIELSIIKEGSKGSQVKALQALLKQFGFKGADNKVLAVDGSAGKNTIYALKNYQKKNNLAVDGYAGPATWSKLLKG